MKIGELAARMDCPAETIRFYEAQGLLPAAQRAPNNYRAYDEEHAGRLGFILRCRSLDMALDEIRVLLRFMDAPGTDCGEVDRLLDAHIGHVAARQRELRGLEKQLKALRELCTESRAARDCGILNELSSAAPTRVRPPRGASTHATHVPRTHGRKEVPR